LYNDINYISRYGQRPSLLFGEPENSYIWERPTIFLRSVLVLAKEDAIEYAPGAYRKRFKQMKVALLRVGIDTGSGGIHGPLFQDGTLNIFRYQMVLEKTNALMEHNRQKGTNLISYFPVSANLKWPSSQSILTRV